eukprot:983446-Prorocentrum_lima.AAC.1
MQILILKGEAEAPPFIPAKLTSSQDEWERLIRRHQRPRRKTFHPHWKSSEPSQFEVDPYKA